MRCSPWGRWESGTTERLHFHFSLSCIGTRKFETSHVGGATCRSPPIPRSALEKDPRPGPLFEAAPRTMNRSRQVTCVAWVHVLMVLSGPHDLPFGCRMVVSHSGPSSSCVWNPRVFADDARGWQCPFELTDFGFSCQLEPGEKLRGLVTWPRPVLGAQALSSALPETPLSTH